MGGAWVPEFPQGRPPAEQSFGLLHGAKISFIVLSHNIHLLQPLLLFSLTRTESELKNIFLMNE